MTQPAETSHPLTMQLYIAGTRSAGLSVLRYADSWGDLLAVADDLAAIAADTENMAGPLVNTQHVQEAVVMVRRLIRIARRGDDWAEFGPDTVEVAVTTGLRDGFWRADVYLALLALLDAIRERRERAA